MIYYKGGYKYQLEADYSLDTGILPKVDLVSAFIAFDTTGRLTIRRGYAWDGPSGPSVDTKDFMRGSLVHDALYQLMREGLLSPDNRESADKLLRDICIEDGMNRPRAWAAYYAVRVFGDPAADSTRDRPVISAP